jgi:hypothetical protein
MQDQEAQALHKFLLFICGMSLSFLKGKSWHVGSAANQEKVWLAEEKAKLHKKNEDAKLKELKAERELMERANVTMSATDAAMMSVSFMYCPALLRN